MTAQRIPTPATAFSVSRSDRKRPRVRNDKHLEWIRTLPCMITGLRQDVEAAHIRMADMMYGKRETGKSEKPSDCWTVPLNRAIHSAQHSMNERLWWVEMGVDPCHIAQSLWFHSGDDIVAESILAEVQRRIKAR